MCWLSRLSVIPTHFTTVSLVFNHWHAISALTSRHLPAADRLLCLRILLLEILLGSHRRPTQTTHQRLRRCRSRRQLGIIHQFARRQRFGLCGDGGRFACDWLVHLPTDEQGSNRCMEGAEVSRSNHPSS